MKEVEVKILEVSYKELEPKLFELGAKKFFEKEFFVKIFDTEDLHFQNNDAILRLRKEGDSTFLAHKIKTGDNDTVKINEETEVEVSSFEEAEKLLSILGFQELEFMRNRKVRVSYQLDGCKVEFDRHLPPFDFIPEFMEIEGTSIEDVYACAKKLGFSKSDCKNWTGKDLIDHYKKEFNRKV